MVPKRKRKQSQIEKYKHHRRQITGFCAAIFFVVLTSVFPLYLHAERYVNLTMHKAYFYWAVTLIVAGMLLLVLLCLRIKSATEGLTAIHLPKITIAEWALLAFLILTLVSAIISDYQDIVWSGIPEPEGRYEGFLTFFCYGLTFWIIARFYTPKDLHFYLFGISSIMVSLIGILQFAGHDIFSLFPYTLSQFIGKNGLPMHGGITIFFRSTLGNIDIVSAYTALTAALFAALYATNLTRLRFLHLGAATGSFALMLIAGADAGKVGLFAAMVLLIPYLLADRQRLGRIFVVLSSWCAVYIGYKEYLWFRARANQVTPTIREYENAVLNNYFKKGEPELTLFWLLLAVTLLLGIILLYALKKVRWPKAMPIVGVIMLGAVLIGTIVGVEILGTRWADQPKNIVFQAREMMHGRMEDYFGTNRGWVWKRSVEVLPEHAWLGTGPDAFYYAMGDEWQAVSAERYRVTFDKAHNHFLQLAVTLGVPALMCYLVFICGLFLTAIKKAFANPILLVAAAGCAAYLAQGFFGVDVPIASPLYWVLLGVMAAAIRIHVVSEIETGRE